LLLFSSLKVSLFRPWSRILLRRRPQPLPWSAATFFRSLFADLSLRGHLGARLVVFSNVSSSNNPFGSSSLLRSIFPVPLPPCLLFFAVGSEPSAPRRSHAPAESSARPLAAGFRLCSARFRRSSTKAPSILSHQPFRKMHESL